MQRKLLQRNLPGGQTSWAHRLVSSSEPSLQSESPSHRHRSDVHSPLRHVNSSGEQVVLQCISSDPSAQSTSPSHLQSEMMQNLGLAHWNSPSLQVVLQSTSSLRSSQLNSPLQRRDPRMQRPSPHLNSDSLQLRGTQPRSSDPSPQSLS